MCAERKYHSVATGSLCPCDHPGFGDGTLNHHAPGGLLVSLHSSSSVGEKPPSVRMFPVARRH